MSLEANKNLARRYLEAWGRGDTNQLMAMLDPKCVTHNLATSEERGVDFEKEACEIWHAGFADTQLTIELLIAEDNKVSTYWLLNATHQGVFVGIAPTGKHVRVPGMEINRIANGKIIEIWRLSDTMSLMQQIGAVASS